GAPAAGNPPSRQKVFICRPQNAAAEQPCARKILSTLASRAYRRPVTDDEIQTLVRFYKAGREQDFDAGVQRGIERILAAPSFLFRIERPPAATPPGAVYRLTDLDLASRLAVVLERSFPYAEMWVASAGGPW